MVQGKRSAGGTAGWIGLLLSLCFLAYSNTFNASWQYDDFGNIVYNSNVHVVKGNLKAFVLAATPMHANQKVSRPLAYLSFAANHLIGGLDVRGYHAVNLVVHGVASFFLFLFIRRLLSLPIHQGRYEKAAARLAWLAAVLWAVHPIQVTAVTYIVQRMSSLAGMFFIMGLYFYLAARSTESGGWRGAGYAACAISGICALLTKENAILFPFVLFLMELVFFKDRVRRPAVKKAVWAAVLLLIVLLGLFVFTEPATLFHPFENRAYTMGERLLTQPRVLFFYLFLIGAPMAARLSILHDITVSQNIFTPWTTLAALIALIASAALLLGFHRKYRLVAFCGIFFILNHAVESSFLNLDLVYEHRNYIPSMLLFVPPALLAHKSLIHWRTNRPLYLAIIVTLAAVIVSFGHTTFLYNDTFKTEGSLWSHVIMRYPRLSIGHNYLGQAYWRLGEYDKALEASQKAIALDHYNAKHQKALGYYNLALYEAYHRNDLIKAQTYLRQSIALHPDYYLFWLELSRVLIHAKAYASAQEVLEQALRRYPDNDALLRLRGIVLLRDNQCRRALQAAERILQNAQPGGRRAEALLLLARGHDCAGEDMTAVAILERVAAEKSAPGFDVLALMALVELLDHGGDDEKRRWAVARLLSATGWHESVGAMTYQNKGFAITAYEPDMAVINRSIRAYLKGEAPE